MGELPLEEGGNQDRNLDLSRLSSWWNPLPIFRFSRIVYNNARFYHDTHAALSWSLAHRTPNLGDRDIGA
jgi:hypothetical protein